jgi:hypothetical protein
VDLSTIFPLVHVEGFIKHLSVPLFTGVIGWITNWTGVLMLFYPIKFIGIRIPGLKTLAQFLPRKVLEVPLGLTSGRFGWQGSERQPSSTNSSTRTRLPNTFSAPLATRSTTSSTGS